MVVGSLIDLKRLVLVDYPNIRGLVPSDIPDITLHLCYRVEALGCHKHLSSVLALSGHMMRLFDAHCHLQDPRILKVAPQLIQKSIDTGIVHFAVNGVSEKDWDVVKQMSDSYPSIVPCFGLHPWFIRERTPTWFTTLRQHMDANPAASVGEIGLDKGSHGKQIGFIDQVEVFRQQLELAKDLNKPASVHCVRAFGDLLEIMKSVGPFPAGVVLHSFLGSAETVPELAKLGAYFSFSGFLMSMKRQKAKKMLMAVPLDRLLLETDAPDGLPSSEGLSSLFLVDGDPSVAQALEIRPDPDASDGASGSKTVLPKDMLNHPANIHRVLEYVASLLEKSKEEVAEISCSNALRLFSYQGSKISNTHTL